MKFAALVLTLSAVFSVHSMDKLKITAHALRAYDHLDVQEKQFSSLVTPDTSLFYIYHSISVTVEAPVTFLKKQLETLCAQTVNNDDVNILRSRAEACHQALTMLYDYAKFCLRKLNPRGELLPEDKAELTQLINFSKLSLKILLMRKEEQKALLQKAGSE